MERREVNSKKHEYDADRNAADKVGIGEEVVLENTLVEIAERECEEERVAPETGEDEGLHERGRKSKMQEEPVESEEENAGRKADENNEGAHQMVEKSTALAGLAVKRAVPFLECECYRRKTVRKEIDVEDLERVEGKR